MRPKKIQISDDLILPFGPARRFDISKIKLSAAAATGIYLTADVPCIYIDRAKQQPLTVFDYNVLIDNHIDEAKLGLYDPSKANIDYVCKIVQSCMPNDTSTTYEHRFLLLYFDYIKSFLNGSVFHRLDNPMLVFNALLPIPQMQLYVHDPLEDDWSRRLEPSNNFRVDFGFWTGTQLIAVEIDGNEPAGYAQDVRRDRLLRRAEVDVIHILNTEIDKHAGEIIEVLLPKEITHDWQRRPAPNFPPLLPF